jgi:2-beta-glucuronyltransferase
MADANFLFLTAHDYRTPRKASMHFIAQEHAKRGKVRFFSLRYSWLSRNRPDGRHGIADLAGRVETVDGVDCFLWKTPLHPVNTHRGWLRLFENAAYKLYAALAPAVLKTWITEADTIYFESGTAVAFFDLAERLNPKAKKVYIASDELDVINVAQFIKDAVYRISPLVAFSRLHSPRTTKDFAPGSKLYFVAQGIDHEIDSYADPSPYGAGQHAVSIGSMLFDAELFAIAGRQFPAVTFHVIGCGVPRPSDWPANVIHYDEMKFRDTVPYIKHASIAFAPYRADNIPVYLADTSLKLAQYAFFGVPAVCPREVMGDYDHRFGYQPGDADSIKTAIEAALVAGLRSGLKVLSWPQVVDRFLDPQAYPETHMDGWENATPMRPTPDSINALR